MKTNFKFSTLDRKAATSLLRTMQDILEETQEQHNLIFDLMMAVRDNDVKKFNKYMDDLNCSANLRNQFDWEPLLQLQQTYEKIGEE